MGGADNILWGWFRGITGVCGIAVFEEAISSLEIEQNRITYGVVYDVMTIVGGRVMGKLEQTQTSLQRVCVPQVGVQHEHQKQVDQAEDQYVTDSNN